MANAAGRRSSLGPPSRPPQPLERALDWPLSKDEKRHCAMKLFQMEIEDNEDEIEDKLEQIDELQHEVKVLRRLSTQSIATTATSISPRSEEAVQPELQEEAPAPPESPEDLPYEASLRQALVTYLSERSRLGLESQAKKPPKQIAHYYGDSEDHVAFFWNSARDKDSLSNLEAVLWLMRSLPASPPVPAQSRARHWRHILLRPDRTRKGYNELRARALALPQAQELQQEVQLELKTAWKGEELMATPGLAEAAAAVSLTISAPKGRHLRGSVQVAALLIYGLLPDSASLAEAETDAFWCFFQLLTEMRSGEDEESRTFRARRVRELLKSYDLGLVEALDGQGLMVFVATRLGEAFCSRGGFPLESCARLWDVVLADPQRFGFCDFLVAALLLLRRNELLRVSHDAEGLAEALLALPRSVPVERALRLARALRALDRREKRAAQALKAHDSSQDEPGVIKVIGSLFGRMREKGADACGFFRTPPRPWRRALSPRKSRRRR
ncbi:unnamed protein product [Effrenium voratum]|uniref:Rab-GAP TBC domain-containing protein n=1 Tax=Effrenium voratum TaxID=2562239 RepID=A0AA36MHC5_9DINO|nr:unnamed protein product [Effrenium voratum]CAJ1371476.1 unnamed protein product [Effrenium voratum]